MRFRGRVHSFSICAGDTAGVERGGRKHMRLRAKLDRTARACALQDAAGRVEACPGSGCPFWEEGGAVLTAGCLLERLSLDLARRHELAQQLLELRYRLDSGASGAAAGRSLFYHLRVTATD